MHLRQREVTEVLDDFLGAETELVPAGNPLNRDTGARHDGTPPATPAPPFDQAANVGNRRHGTIIP
jgi:hypothetical protein